MKGYLSNTAPVTSATPWSKAALLTCPTHSNPRPWPPGSGHRHGSPPDAPRPSDRRWPVGFPDRGRGVGHRSARHGGRARGTGCLFLLRETFVRETSSCMIMSQEPLVSPPFSHLLFCFWWRAGGCVSLHSAGRAAASRGVPSVDGVS